VVRKLVVHSAEQIALLYENGDVVRRYRISTAANGSVAPQIAIARRMAGCPIAEKIGSNLREAQSEEPESNGRDLEPRPG